VETGPGTLSVTWRGMRRTLAPRALAQTDADPAIEVLVHVADRAVGGSHRHHALIAVDRDPATGQYRPD
ncbi:MAG: hypothetical protein GVY28_03005, partial [Alphaproteobacteria bacterium]|nr:hypothetical protein [Alphaproteobacteria bacterium]